MAKNIVVCLDGSTLAEQILPFVKDQAKGIGAKLILLQVIGGTTQVLSTASLEAGMMVSPTGADIALSLEQMNAIKDDVQRYLDGHVGTGDTKFHKTCASTYLYNGLDRITTTIRSSSLIGSL